MVEIRRATIEDLPKMQHCNLWCLPENYTFKYYFFHYLSHPQILYVADFDSKIVGYVLAKIEEEDNENETHGHITSISVLRSYRRLGIAYKLMVATHEDMHKLYGAKFCSLHVRISNRAAIGLYKDRLGYIKRGVEEKYYADDEDAWDMAKYFVPPKEKKEIKESENDKKEEEEKKIEEKKIEEKKEISPEQQKLQQEEEKEKEKTEQEIKIQENQEAKKKKNKKKKKN